MSENKIAKVPVASHGLHKHSYNYPWLSSINFGDVMPCYINPIRKGERDNPKAGLYSQLMPILHNAFATGRFNFKAIFVPYKLVWRPWYAFDQQTDYYSNGQMARITRYPYVQHGVLTSELISAGYLTLSTDPDPDVYDVIVLDSNNVVQRYMASDAGRRILRILGALGCTPSFIEGDKKTLNILPIMCYLKAYADYYFPNNYVGNIPYNALVSFCERDAVSYDLEISNLCVALEVASLNHYENSIFDIAWDNPVTPNVNSNVPSVSISDESNNNSFPQVVTNDASAVGSPSGVNYKPTNGTPFVGGSNSDVSSATGVITKFVIDSLTALSLWAKRKQLSGARLLDRFLVSRGVTLPNDSARMSWFVGQRNVEIQVSGVENNSDTNLGELAGRGVASSGDNPLSFEVRPDDDGIFFVIVSPIPDANFPVLLDGYACRQDFLDNYTAEYDKLGAAAVPTRCIIQRLSGADNSLADLNPTWGFLSQYWDEVQERPRLLGDFLLPARGAKELQAYHTFRLFEPISAISHSYNFIRMQDSSQYQRLFYSDKQENLMLFLRWYGDQYKEKLPLGDSYDWDDDELNRKVSLVVGGSQK